MSNNKFWIAPYKMASAGAKLLAEKMDCLRIKTEGSDFVGKEGQVVLNWGNGVGYLRAKVGKAELWNPPALVDIAIDKRAFFDHMTDAGGPRLPHWTTLQGQAKKWLDDGNEVVARTVVEGQRGQGIVVMKNLLDFVRAPLYTIKVDNKSEYRVYTFFNKVIDVRLKEGKPDANGMLVGEDIEFPPFPGWQDKTPPDVIKQVEKATKKLGLAVAGYDVIWDGGKAFVLEANTAPYLGIQTANAYAKAIKEKLNA